ncbi:type VII secretion-associated serine protease mycosin [Mycobacterium avium subsp. hominissuis]|uniref:Type VII secretion-associated serine protease mycosin n=2 Tax=Mycobacterium avium TaxID=1764 RepID=A0A2A3LAX4_MYCAV|nr:type VII secretion-associated serine protease mycosin [Mycobacterium avium]MBZ4632716.1 type VII secretion-associated serine protease mycosin [Mycobacterium avium subsp. hominissuis]MDV3306331.1 type VII secretion-associated serine protease mycosin [Mycobacterium avium subsp. hominissuis]PBJ37206.1 type VII secretion-associated serine protease mycosin [Mycobacterium avium subsp. hominissuis]PBJ66057.1 type VII secretion-associated serine protease mycosin [Mycobacterium avium subsp. hominissu
MHPIGRVAALAIVTLTVAAVGYAPPAAAIAPPTIDLAADIAPPDADPAPALPMKQNTVCATSAVLADSQFNTIPASDVFGVGELHNFARGDGQVVAVIDSGVQPVTRLARLRGGGDYLVSGDGLSDCDHHGTLIAGIIAAAPSPKDGFVGVAPGAEIVSIRQTSAAFTEEHLPPGYGEADRSAANLMALAKAIVHAANLGATVINLSITACYDAGSPVDLRPLAGALYYAAVVHDAVIVAAAGNTGDQQHQTCQPNPGYDPANPGDARNWDGVRSVSLPSYFSDLVLSVAGTTLTGDPYVNSMPGPWVGAAAPSMNIVSLDPTEPQPGALTNAALVKGAPIPLNGTSFAAAYVSGLAALIREKYKDLSAHQVINRILATSHTPAQGLTNTLGAGIIDAKAALTADVPRGDIVAPGVPSVAAPAPKPPPAKDNTARNVSLIALGATVAVLAVVALTVFATRRSDS